MVEFQKIDLCLDTEEWFLLLVCSHSSEGSVFSQQCCTTWIFIWQNSKTGHYLAPYAATNPQSIDLHVKWETSNLPPNAWITIVQTEWDIFPDSAAKLWFMKDENNKLDFNKTGSFSLKKTRLGESSIRDWMWINYKSCIQCCNLWRFLPFLSKSTVTNDIKIKLNLGLKLSSRALGWHPGDLCIQPSVLSGNKNRAGTLDWRSSWWSGDAL